MNKYLKILSLKVVVYGCGNPPTNEPEIQIDKVEALNDFIPIKKSVD